MGLKESLINTLFLTFLHNQYAIAFLCGALISLGILLIRPSRYATLLLGGFLILLVGFEYNKHIIEPLQDQTLSSLGLSNNNGGSGKVFLLRTFQKLLPIFFFITGWGSVFLAIILKGLSGRKSKNSN